MPTGYPLRNAIVQFYDGSATPKKLTITYYGSIPELPDVVITRNLEPKLDRGQFRYVMFGDDSVEFPEVTFEMDVVDDYVISNKHSVIEWFKNRKDTSGDGLTTTNDGNATAKDVDSNTTVNYGLPSSIFTCGMKVWIEDAKSTTGKGFGFDYKYVQPLDVTFTSSNDGTKLTIRVRLLGSRTDLTVKPT